MSELTLLVINCAPMLEHAMVDALLSLPAVQGFTSLRVQGHGQGGAMTVAEQVAGRRERVQFQLMLGTEALDACLAALGRQFAGAGLVYWAYPLRAGGALSAPAEVDAPAPS